MAVGSTARSATGTASEDYAASLRAAALMTLKAKKRKATTSPAEPMRPHRAYPMTDTIELDYGQEEPVGTLSIASSSPAAATSAKPVASTSSVSVPEQMQVDGDSAREEGEISDSEMAPPTPMAKPESISPALEEPSHTTAQKATGLPQEPASVVAEIPPVVIASPRVSSAVPPTLIDENHVRPGLALTQAQYDTAKDIILDLLGWGVPPEYLVSCGLSREIVYYVFVELNLRLPSNLDTTGLPPIPVPSSAQTTPSVTPPRHGLYHPSLPPRPVPQTEEASPSLAADVSCTLSATAQPFVPAASDTGTATSSTSVTSLHDIEQQRKQELLARKAVLASRKTRPKASTSTTIASRTVDRSDPSGDQPSDCSVPPKVVEDFLQSIEPTASTASSASYSKAPVPARSIYDMDIDDVPGLTTVQEPITEYTPLPRPPPPTPWSAPISSTTSPRSPAAPQSANSSTSDRPFDRAPSTSSFSTTPLSYDLDEDMDAVPGLYHSRTTSDDVKPPKSRRGTKRPVAADFVDMDLGPSRAPTRRPSDLFRANIRRKTTGFAGITQRRCIIDLSDSEQEEDNSAGPVSVPLRSNSHGPQATPQATVAPTARQHSPAVVPPIIPVVLQEKEAEIRRMRELIAQREQSRKKKLAASSRSTPTSASTPTNGVISIKQEDDDSTDRRALDASRSTSSATPDPMNYGRPNDSQDERSVIAALLPHGRLSY
ncbi:hypothetical protein BD414DRAFT_421433 [Trametes punicea]|nr:hypothetical protein BD414DRAFT_421433 [Trametes punicea]